ncbi:MAG: hypothetical protein MMC33_001376 [Icmadophila ericetorum]|nr:hypothetical protein [Icmadophila ericetorum]
MVQLKKKEASASSPTEYEEPYRQRDLMKELQYLPDPLRLAEKIAQFLAKGSHERAVALVRLASRDMACTVSWNYIIDYYMQKSCPEIAEKLYNEVKLGYCVGLSTRWLTSLQMKKRAQVPDAYTFTTLLRGLAKNMYRSRAEAVKHALMIYESMKAPNSPVQPSIVHANAVLQVCAYHGEVDTAFGIAAQLPSRGKGAPDNWTYTIILNAIRHGIIDNNKRANLHPKGQLALKTEQAVTQGRRIWVEVIAKWRNGILSVDEELVGAIGRLLILGSQPEDIDDIFSLLEQTMGIPRLILRLNDPSRINHVRGSHHRPVKFSSDDQNFQSHDSKGDRSIKNSSQPVSTSENSQALTFSSEFDPVPPSKRSVRAYAKPGHNTLSLVLEACLYFSAYKPAAKYLKIFIDTYQIVPDSANIHMYLRLLRSARASRAATECLEHMILHSPDGLGAQPKTFRIAMSTCVRDSKNRNVGVFAERIMKLMKKALGEPDLKTCEMYLGVMGRENVSWSEQRSALNILDDLIDDWARFLGDGEVNANLISSSKQDGTSTADEKHGKKKWIGQIPSNTATTLDFVRKLIGVYDKVLKGSSYDEIPEKARVMLERKRSMLAAFVTRAFHPGDPVQRKSRKHISLADDENLPLDELQHQARAMRGPRSSMPTLAERMRMKASDRFRRLPVGGLLEVGKSKSRRPKLKEFSHKRWRLVNLQM